MKLLEDRIISEGRVKPGDVLKVDSFINHRMDIQLFNEMGREWKRIFDGVPINKILTIEASGIGIAAIAAQYFNASVVFAKKTRTINLDGELYVSSVESFTHQCTYSVVVSKKFIVPSDNILIIDDFLANGSAVTALMDIIGQAGASLAGVGIAIEKGYMPGGRLLRDMGIRVESLAIIDSMDPVSGNITFRRN